MTLPVTTESDGACCGTPAQARVDEVEAARLAHTFKALADPTRVRLLSLIASSAQGEACICDLIEPVGLSQGTVSHHMKLLTEAGLVTREQRGKWAYFSITAAAIDAAAASLRAL